MRFHTRAFLFSFVPFAFLLALSFLLVQSHVQRTVRQGLRDSLRQSQRTVARVRDANSLHNRQSLKEALADEDLLTAIQPAATPTATPITGNDGATAVQPDTSTPEIDPLLQPTLQDELLKFGVHAGHDLLIVTAPNGKPLAGAVRAGEGSSELVPMYVFPQMEKGGLLLFRGEPFQTETAPLVINGQTIGRLTVGEHLDQSLFATSSVLLHGSRALYSNLENTSLLEIGEQLGHCQKGVECDIHLKGVRWMSLPILADQGTGGWTLYSLVNVDQATAPVLSTIRVIFLTVALLALITTLVCSVVSSRAVVQPIAAMVAHLHASAQTGILPEFRGCQTNIFEVRELARTYNLTAGAVRNAQATLQDAYVEFVYSLAHALDARDKYTAGHSKRVSDLSCAIAAAMGHSQADIDRIRIGALLHDIGKIGVSDLLLQKPGRLSDEEFKLIKRHPSIGRRILQSVQGFAQYLPAVELHHENWDGTGYPQRHRGEDIPLDARIIHVADAYDAMTTDRSYRPRTTHDRAIDVLVENAGTQFDPDVVAALMSVADLAQTKVSTSGVASPVERPVSPDFWPVHPVFMRDHQVSATPSGARIQEFIESASHPVC